MPGGLRSAYVEALAPAAMLAPIPLYFTQGISARALLVYEAAILFLWWRARLGRPVRLPDLALNLAGLGYFLVLGFEVSVLRHGLLRCVSHLLLFTALAKLASIKTAGEARTALLVLFLLSLAAASTSTHVTSLLYFGVMALAAFQALARLAVLADFAEAPPPSVLRSVPTLAVSVAGIAAAGALSLPLFYGLPRLRGPYAIAPFRLDDSFATTLAADRVDLESFGAAKRSDRVVLRLTADPADATRVVRLREAVFTDYRDGVWTRRSPSAHRSPWPAERRDARGGEPVRIDLNLFAKGFLFLPYGMETLELEGGRSAHLLSDGLVQASPGRRTVTYDVGLGRPAPIRGFGESAIDPRTVPAEIRDYAAKIVGEERDPSAIYHRIEEHLRRDFVYTLDPPAARDDPLVHFLLRSRAGHCEYFASAAAMMLASRGIRARLVTGSYGGEVGLFSRSVVVRGGNLHAWVEADLDGSGFSVLDPTPPSGVPAPTTHGSLWRRLAGLGREIEFFYDRRILGFEALDQQRLFETARDRLGSVADSASGWKGVFGEGRLPVGRVLAFVAAAAALFVLVREWRRRRTRVSPATRAYVALRDLLARRAGALSPAVPPAEIARRFADSAPAGADDASAVVRIYCASVFGGRELDPGSARELELRLRRLRKLA
jgi:transglutaminase-like putative cysteine protease